MGVQLYAFTCGYVTVPAGWLLDGREGAMTVPVPSYLIVHPKGRVVFDTGLHVDTQHDQVSYLGEAFHKYEQCHFAPGEEISARLRAMDIDPDKIEFVVNSHLHFDHCGGNALLPNATVIVQRRELAHGSSAGGGYIKKDWDTGQKIKTIDGEFDLFGDGSVMILPTYGHTPGHQSMRVRTEDGGDFVLCADACYLKDTLDNLHLPGIVADPEATLAVLKRFREMQLGGAIIMYGHDPDAWKSVRQGPERLG